MKMKSTAILRHLRISPRKVRLLVDLIRGEKVGRALNQLSLSRKDAAIPVKKLLESSMANAIHNHKVDPETLVVHSAFVNEGKTLYRFMPRAMGRATPLRKRTAHVTITVEGDVKEQTATESVQEAVVEEPMNAAPKKVVKKKATTVKKVTKTKKTTDA